MKFEAMKDEYYAIRGGDKEAGIPTKEKLAEPGLASASLDAAPAGA
jgi:aldehyde:ferredoxin oxidoreductase